VSVPLLARDRCVGVLNAFYPPERTPDADALEFLAAIADQAAMAVDYTELLMRSGAQARRDERKRLTRDLHDSVVQQVFSLRMHASALTVQLEQNPAGLDHAKLLRVSHELAELAEHALVDLRELLFELRPGSLRGGLLDAAHDCAARVHSRDGLVVTVEAPAELPDLPVELEEDLYRILQEALHNTVKHAQAHTACVRFTMRGHDELVMEISDDGRGADPANKSQHTSQHTSQNTSQNTLGLASMRERVRRWGGSLTAGAATGRGYLVRVVIGDLTLLINRSVPGEENELP
jgi:signal transduction histidine kinase